VDGAELFALEIVDIGALDLAGGDQGTGCNLGYVSHIDLLRLVCPPPTPGEGCGCTAGPRHAEPRHPEPPHCGAVFAVALSSELRAAPCVHVFGEARESTTCARTVTGTEGRSSSPRTITCWVKWCAISCASVVSNPSAHSPPWRKRAKWRGTIRSTARCS